MTVGCNKFPSFSRFPFSSLSVSLVFACRLSTFASLEDDLLTLSRDPRAGCHKVEAFFLPYRFLSACFLRLLTHSRNRRVLALNVSFRLSIIIIHVASTKRIILSSILSGTTHFSFRFSSISFLSISSCVYQQVFIRRRYFNVLIVEMTRNKGEKTKDAN